MKISKLANPLICIVVILLIPSLALSKNADFGYRTIYNIEEFSDIDGIVIIRWLGFGDNYRGPVELNANAPRYNTLSPEPLKSVVSTIFKDFPQIPISIMGDNEMNEGKLYLSFSLASPPFEKGSSVSPAVISMQILKVQNGTLRALSSTYPIAYPFILKRNPNQEKNNGIDTKQLDKDSKKAVHVLAGFLPAYIGCAKRIRGAYYCDRMFETQKYNEGTPSYIIKEIEDLKVNGKLPPATDLPY